MSCILTANMNVDIEVFRSSRAEIAASRLILFVTFCLRDSPFICGPGPICPWSAFAQTRKSSKKNKRKSVKQVKNCSVIHLSEETETWYMLLIEAIAAGTKYLPLSKTCFLHEARSIVIVSDSICNEKLIGHMHESSTWQKVTELEMLPCVPHARIVGTISFSWVPCNVFHGM